MSANWSSSENIFSLGVLPPVSSRPEEFHLRALPEPCMTLSSHTAPDVRPLLERLCFVHRLLPFPVGQWPRLNNATPSLNQAIRRIDEAFGAGYAKGHPELVAALVQAAAFDRVAKAIRSHPAAGDLARKFLLAE